MPAPEQDERIEALTREVASLRRRLEESERRLSSLEGAFGGPLATAVCPQPAPEPVAAPPLVPPILPTAPVPLASYSPAPRPQFETRLGLNWINRIGAITLVLGIGFFFKYAIDNRWIGETGRVLLGIFAGCAALAVADSLWKRDQKVFAQGISGTGIAILFLSFYASHGFYRLIPLTPAFLLMALTTVLAGALAIRYDSAAIAALGLFGGYATPVLLSTGADRPWFFFSYLLLLDSGAIAIARRRRWGRLEWFALGATVYLFGRWFGINFEPGKEVVATVFAFSLYGLLASSGIREISFVAQLATMTGIALFRAHDLLPYSALTLVLVISGLAIADRRAWSAAPSVTFAGFWFSYALWRMQSRPTEWIAGLLTFAFLVFLAWIPWRLRVRRRPFTREDLLLVPLNGIFYFGGIYSLFHADHHGLLGPLAAALALVYAGIALLLRDIDISEKWLCAGVGGAFLTMAIPIQFAGFRITMAWALEAAAISWTGVRTATRQIVYAACAVFGLTLLRLICFDSWIYRWPGLYGAVFNLRFLTFVIVAASLWACAYWVKAGTVALATYLAGHAVMLWGLILEVFGWAGRTSALENLLSVESASISILMATYAVLLVMAGVATRTAVNRISGLALIAAVVAKLYLYDVWLLVRIYRVTAFAGLGLLLLLTSYLYSRYRGSIENWWTDR